MFYASSNGIICGSRNTFLRSHQELGELKKGLTSATIVALKEYIIENDKSCKDQIGLIVKDPSETLVWFNFAKHGFLLYIHLCHLDRYSQNPKKKMAQNYRTLWSKKIPKGLNQGCSELLRVLNQFLGGSVILGNIFDLIFKGGKLA